MNSDASVRSIKGPRRPINDQRSRAAVLLSLRPVDYVCVFDEPTPLELIKIVRPDVLVKGGDWRKGEIVGAGFVESYRGRVVTIPVVRRISTTKIIERICKLYA